jgi:hypothetical protein
VHLGRADMLELGILIVGLVVGFIFGAYTATINTVRQYQDVFKSVHADLRTVHSDLLALKRERESRG